MTPIASSTAGKFAHAFCLIALLLALAGCTAKLVYNRLDTLAAWYLESIVPLDTTQKVEVRTWLGETLAWHRGSELQRYAQFLRRLSTDLAAPAPADTYAQAAQRFASFWNDFAARTAPDAARLLSTLTPAQLDELDRNVEKRATERAADEARQIAAGKWRRERERDFVRQLRRWTGSVSDEQRAIIQNAVAGLEPTHAEWLDSQRAWRASLRSAILEEEVGAETRIATLLRAPQQEWTAAYRSKQAHNRSQILELLATLDPTLSAAQRAKLQRELHDIAGQLEKLAT